MKRQVGNIIYDVIVCATVGIP
jgi:hypothetical protein